MLLLHKQKIINIKQISITRAQRLKFFVEQWAWFVLWRQVRLIRKFWISPSLLNQIESESSDSNLNQISKLRRSLSLMSQSQVILGDKSFQPITWLWSVNIIKCVYANIIYFILFHSYLSFMFISAVKKIYFNFIHSMVECGNYENLSNLWGNIYKYT